MGRITVSRSKGAAGRWSDFNERRTFARVVRVCWTDSKTVQFKRYGELNVSRACREIASGGDSYSLHKRLPRAKEKLSSDALRKAIMGGRTRHLVRTWDSRKDQLPKSAKAIKEAFYRVMNRLQSVDTETSEQSKAREQYATWCAFSIACGLAAAAGDHDLDRYADDGEKLLSWARDHLASKKSTAA